MKKTIILILTFFFTACSSFYQAPPVYRSMNHYLPWAQRKAQLNALSDWQANGNITIHAQTGYGTNTSFSWQQIGQNYQLRLFGPFGIQSILLAGNPRQVTLLAHDQAVTARNAEELLARQLGLHLPVSQLYYWLRGLPAPQARYRINLDAYNRAMKLRQSGWHINYLQYTNRGKVDIPQRIDLYNCQWKINILITDWNLK